MAQSRLKLAFIHPAFAVYGGAEDYLITAMNLLAQKGHQVDLYTAIYDTAHFPTGNFTIQLLGGRGYLESIPGTFRLAHRLHRHLTDYDCLIPVNFPAPIWVNLFPKPNPVLWLCMEPKRSLYPAVMNPEQPIEYRHARSYRARDWWRLFSTDAHVLLPYSVRAALQRALDQYTARRLQSIVTHSNYTAAKIRRIYPDRPVQAIGAPVIFPLRTHQPAEPFFLVPTRLEPIKNVGNVIEAVQQLAATGTPYHAVIMGTGSQADHLRQLVRQKSLDHWIKFTGFVEPHERERLYQCCAFVVYPALAEPFGLPCLEAGLYAKAVLAANQGGPAEIIQHEQTGLLVDMTQPNQIAAGIRQLIHEAAPMGTAARVNVEVRYGNWVTHFEQILFNLVRGG